MLPWVSSTLHFTFCIYPLFFALQRFGEAAEGGGLPFALQRSGEAAEGVGLPFALQRFGEAAEGVGLPFALQRSGEAAEGVGGGDGADGRKGIRSFAKRAFRRPAADGREGGIRR